MEPNPKGRAGGGKGAYFGRSYDDWKLLLGLLWRRPSVLLLPCYPCISPPSQSSPYQIEIEWKIKEGKEESSSSQYSLPFLL